MGFHFLVNLQINSINSRLNSRSIINRIQHYMDGESGSIDICDHCPTLESCTLLNVLSSDTNAALTHYVCHLSNGLLSDVTNDEKNTGYKQVETSDSKCLYTKKELNNLIILYLRLFDQDIILCKHAIVCTPKDQIQKHLKTMFSLRKTQS